MTSNKLPAEVVNQDAIIAAQRAWTDKDQSGGGFSDCWHSAIAAALEALGIYWRPIAEFKFVSDCCLEGNFCEYLMLRGDELITVRQLPKMHGHDFADRNETYYLRTYFTHFMPLEPLIELYKERV